MKKWKGQVCMPMWQEIEVEAETDEEAEAMMLDQFDLASAEPGEAYVCELDEFVEE